MRVVCHTRWLAENVKFTRKLQSAASFFLGGMGWRGWGWGGELASIKCLGKVKVPVRAEARMAALISVSVALSQTPCKTTDTGLVRRVVCLFTSQLSLVPNYTGW